MTELGTVVGIRYSDGDMKLRPYGEYSRFERIVRLVFPRYHEIFPVGCLIKDDEDEWIVASGAMAYATMVWKNPLWKHPFGSIELGEEDE